MTNFIPKKMTGNYNPSKQWEAYVARGGYGTKGNLAQCLSFVSECMGDDTLTYVITLVECLSEGFCSHDDFSIRYDDDYDDWYSIWHRI
jgi:hypothetical protein